MRITSFGIKSTAQERPNAKIPRPGDVRCPGSGSSGHFSRCPQSITFDNGGGFSKHGLIRDALKMSTWFCDAYASWQKGAVENMNGRLRRDLPRNRDIDKMSDEELQDILLSHNLTPRKCLGFKTPAQAILKELGIDVKMVFRSNVALRV